MSCAPLWVGRALLKISTQSAEVAFALHKGRKDTVQKFKKEKDKKGKNTGAHVVPSGTCQCLVKVMIQGR